MILEYKVIILDFDGVIVESVGIKDQAFKQLFQDYPEHLDAIMDYHLSHNATIRFEKFRYITENILGLVYDEYQFQQLCDSFSKLVFNQIIECSYVPGAIKFLEYFNKKIPLYLVSMSPDSELNRILIKRNIHKYFRKVYASTWKKDEAIEDILAKEAIALDRAVFIGDSPEDYIAAKKTGIAFIGRKSNKRFPEPDILVLDDLIEIKEKIAS
jgi:HAD superfamily hydrolase (TIGR01549 family)